MSTSQFDAVQLSDEQCANALVSSSAVHVNGCAQGQYEGGNLFGNAHLLRAAHGQGQGATGGAGAECHQECRGNAFEELENISAGNKFQQSTIYDNCMYQASQVYSHNNLQQGQQYCRTVSSNNRSNQTEYADRSNGHDVAYHFVGYFSQTIDGVF